MEVQIDLKECHVWVCPEGFLWMSVPDPSHRYFLSMIDVHGKVMPNAYGKEIWEKLGWECLGVIDDGATKK
jgi:predicted SAM-dependent methyltransferase